MALARLASLVTPFRRPSQDHLLPGCPLFTPIVSSSANQCQVDYFSTVARDGEQVPKFVSSSVLPIDDPLAVWRPGLAVLPFVGLRQLNRPSAVGIHFPQIRAAGNVGGERNLLAVRRPGGAGNRACEIEIINRMGRALGLAAEVSVLGSEISRVSGPDDWAIVEVLEMRRKNREVVSRDFMATSSETDVRPRTPLGVEQAGSYTVAESRI